jgi:aconitate hydratase
MGLDAPPVPVIGARILVMLGDNITTDHISPVGAIPAAGSVGQHLQAHGVKPEDFNLHLSWRANPDVVARTTFANLQLRNEVVPGIEGGITRHHPSGEIMPIFEASLRYQAVHVPLVIVAGANYGAGSSRDTAAKGSALIGVRAVIAENFERIHRTNLVGCGVLPLQFPTGVTRKTLGLDGTELVTLIGSDKPMHSLMQLQCRFDRDDGTSQTVKVRLRVDTPREMRWIEAGGILPFAGNALLNKAQETTHG